MTMLKVLALVAFLFVSGCATSPNDTNAPAIEPQIEEADDQKGDGEKRGASQGSGVSAVAMGGVIQMLFLLL